MNGWFGNIMAGGGSDLRGKDDDGVAIKNDFRFQGASMIAKFSESDHIAFIGNANNTNNRGFNDLAGNMMAGMRGGGMRGGGGMRDVYKRQLPNLPSAQVPEGRTAEDNVIVRQGGVIPDLGETSKPH